MDGTESRVTWHRELDELSADVLRLGAMTCETVPRGTDVLLTGDLDGAQSLIELDDQIDALSVDLEERCWSIIVRQAPKAGELRRVVTVIKLIAELERSADLMVNVCKATRRMYGSPMTPKIRGILSSMSAEAQQLLRFSLDAFADENAGLGRALADIDDRLDQLNRDMVEAIFEGNSSGDIDLAVAVQLALVSRYYERIGDHAVNIGERVTYMVTGWLPEHQGAMRAAEADRRATVEGDDPEPTASP